MDEDVIVNVFGPYENVYFSMAVIYKDIKLEEVDSYMAQVFNAMIQFGIVTKDEKLISLVHLISTLNSHFTFVERFEHRTGKPTKEEILQLSTGVLDNHSSDLTPINFRVNYDVAKPIQYYGRLSNVKTDPKRISDSIEHVLEEFPESNIGYIMTKKANPN